MLEMLLGAAIMLVGIVVGAALVRTTTERNGIGLLEQARRDNPHGN